MNDTRYYQIQSVLWVNLTLLSIILEQLVQSGTVGSVLIWTVAVIGIWYSLYSIETVRDWVAEHRSGVPFVGGDQA